MLKRERSKSTISKILYNIIYENSLYLLFHLNQTILCVLQRLYQLFTLILKKTKPKLITIFYKTKTLLSEACFDSSSIILLFLILTYFLFNKTLAKTK